MKINVVQKTKLAYDSTFQFSHSLNGRCCCFIVSCLGIDFNDPVKARIATSYPTSGVNIHCTVCVTTGYFTHQRGADIPWSEWSLTSGPLTCTGPFQGPRRGPSNTLQCPEILQLIYERNLIEFFSSLTTILKIYMTLPITICETETSINYQ